MQVLMAAFLVWTLLSPQGRGGEAWPTHTACRDESLQVLYQSCDALQDFGLSVDQCLKQVKPNINIRFGIILREDIKELFLDIALFSKGLSILNFSYPICEVDQPKFSFCGRRKGVRRPLTVAASPVAEHRLRTRRLSGHGSRAQPLRGMWDLPGLGHEPASPASKGGLSTTAPPGKP
nr:lymphocyte antigen 86 isoform X1 [Globicephala melas]